MSDTLATSLTMPTAAARMPEVRKTIEECANDSKEIGWVLNVYGETSNGEDDLEPIAAILQRLDIAFDHATEGKYDHDAKARYFRPADGDSPAFDRTLLTTQAEHPVFELRELKEYADKGPPWNNPGLVDKLTAGSYGRVGVKCHGLAAGSAVLDRGPAVQRSRS